MNNAVDLLVVSSLRAILWEHRRGLWGTVPARPARAGDVLDLYFEEGRRADLPADPPLSRAQLVGLVLEPAGSDHELRAYRLLFRPVVFERLDDFAAPLVQSKNTREALCALGNSI